MDQNQKQPAWITGKAPEPNKNRNWGAALVLLFLVIVIYNFVKSDPPDKTKNSSPDTAMQVINLPVDSSDKTQGTSTEATTKDTVKDFGYKKMADLENNRTALIKRIKNLDNSAEFENGLPIDGLDNYNAQDNFNNVIQIIGNRDHIKEVSWALIPNESEKRTAISAARFYAFAGMFGGEDSKKWVLNRFSDISIDFETAFSDSTVIGKNRFIVEYTPDLKVVNLTIRHK